MAPFWINMALEKVAREIRAQLRTVLGLDCKVTLVEPRSIERSTVRQNAS